MKPFMTRVFGSFSRPSRTNRTGRRAARFQIEGLERRDCQTGLTIGTLAVAAETLLAADVSRFVGDAATAELKSPTLLGKTIANDIVTIAVDSKTNTIGHLFGDFNTLAGHLQAENSLVSAFHLPSSWALINNTTIYSDLYHVDYDANVLIAINNVIMSFATPTAGQNTSTGAGSAIDYAYASMNQLTTDVSMPYSLTSTSLGGYPSASGSGITLSAGQAGPILSSQFKSTWGASPGTLTATLVDTGNLTSTQMNSALSAYIPSNFTTTFVQNNPLIKDALGMV
jgi:hypothetical protein